MLLLQILHNISIDVSFLMIWSYFHHEYAKKICAEKKHILLWNWWKNKKKIQFIPVKICFVLFLFDLFCFGYILFLIPFFKLHLLYMGKLWKLENAKHFKMCIYCCVVINICIWYFFYIWRRACILLHENVFNENFPPLLLSFALRINNLYDPKSKHFAWVLKYTTLYI